MAKRKNRKTIQKRRTPKRLSHTLYSYVEPANGKYARSYGKKWFGSFSSYVDKLISMDRKMRFSAKFIKGSKATKGTKVAKLHVVKGGKQAEQKAA